MFKPRPEIIPFSLATGRTEVSVDKPSKEPSIPELLSEWRATERATKVAQDAREVAATSLLAATAAQEAARDSNQAAEAASASARASVAAAEKATRAARLAATAAGDASTTAEGDLARADQALAGATGAETDARERFQQAQDRERR